MVGDFGPTKRVRVKHIGVIRVPPLKDEAEHRCVTVKGLDTHDERSPFRRLLGEENCHLLVLVF